MSTINWNDATHPVWGLLRLTIYMVSLTIILYLTAEKFDDTELRTLASMFVIGGSAEGTIQLVKSLRGNARERSNESTTDNDS